MPLLSEHFFDHPDTRKLQYPEPVLLHIVAMSYCEHVDSRGFLNKSALKSVFEMVGTGCWHISQAKSIKKLLKVGWWIESKDGFYIPETNLFKYTRRVIGKQNPTRIKFKSIRKQAWDYLIAKYDVACTHCGSTENLTVDHIKPIAKGGTNNFENLQILCRSCNCRKHTRYEE